MWLSGTPIRFASWLIPEINHPKEFMSSLVLIIIDHHLFSGLLIPNYILFFRIILSSHIDSRF